MTAELEPAVNADRMRRIGHAAGKVIGVALVVLVAVLTVLAFLAVVAAAIWGIGWAWHGVAWLYSQAL